MLHSRFPLAAACLVFGVVATGLFIHPSAVRAADSPPLPPGYAANEPSSGINFTVLDNILTSGSSKPQPATLANIAERVRAQTGANFVLQPGVGRIVVSDVTLRGADLPAFAKAVQILTGGAVFCEGVEDNLWAMQWLEPPPPRTVAVFNLGPFFQAQIDAKTNPTAPAAPLALEEAQGDGGPSILQVFTLRYARPEDVVQAVTPLISIRGASAQGDGGRRTVVVTAPAKRMEAVGKFIAQMDQPPASLGTAEMSDQVDQIGEMVQQALAALNFQANAGAPPQFQFHAATQTLVVIGSPQSLDVTRKIVAALPGLAPVAVFSGPGFDNGRDVLTIASDARARDLESLLRDAARRRNTSPTAAREYERLLEAAAAIRPPDPQSFTPAAGARVYITPGTPLDLAPSTAPAEQAIFISPPSAGTVQMNPPVASPRSGGQ